MIELPDGVEPNGASVTLIDFGLTLRPATGGAVQRVSRPGSRYRIDLTFPPQKPAAARRALSRLIEAKRTGGLRVELPLLDQHQGLPGTPVVDGAGQAGTTLLLRGLTPGYAFREGFWLNLFDAAGQPYLHNCRSNAVADGAGEASILIEPPLRVPFADGATVELAKPVVEGFIDGGEWSWEIDVQRLYGIAVTVEEAA